MKAVSAFIKKGLIVLVGVSLFAGLALAALPNGSAAASPLHQTGNPPAGRTTDQVTARLEKVYQNEQQALTRQAKVFSNVDKLTNRVGTAITRLQNNGRDAIPLQTALAVFNAAIAGARREHDRAAPILATHAGFDANGKVTDQTLARSTVRDAGASLKNAHLMAQAAVKNLRNVLQRYIKASRPSGQATPAQTPTPTPAQ